MGLEKSPRDLAKRAPERPPRDPPETPFFGSPKLRIGVPLGEMLPRGAPALQVCNRFLGHSRGEIAGRGRRNWIRSLQNGFVCTRRRPLLNSLCGCLLRHPLEHVDLDCSICSRQPRRLPAATAGRRGNFPQRAHPPY
jgi:hypothetical protein